MSIDLSRRGFLGGSIALGSAATFLSPPPAAAGTEPSDSLVSTVPLHTTVNGKAVALVVSGDASALHVLREELMLRGTKEACGQGVCGACAIRVDGEVVNSCLLPAVALEGRQVVTVEGLGPELHPIQRAFLAEDALQCGYCTPGFVMESASFCDRWRGEKGAADPGEEAVASALAGHLCRCGAYDGIQRAVRGACSGRFDANTSSSPRMDGLEKVTGTATYTVDVSLPKMLHARIFRSSIACGVVQKIDFTSALSQTGVVSVLPLVKPGSRVRYAGQALVAVAAETEVQAKEALHHIRVEMAEERAVITMEQALAPGATVVYDSERRTAPLAAETPLFPEPWKGNLRGPLRASILLDPASVASGFRAVERGQGTRVEGRYTTHGQSHTALEPHACVASWEGEDRLTLHASTQACSALAELIAARWKLPTENVRVLCPYVGGGFGAKANVSMEIVVAINLSRQTQRPVRVALDRAEELTVTGYRPGARIDLEAAAGKEGELLALRTIAYTDAGAAVGGGGTGFLLRWMYPSRRKTLHDYDVLTHTPPGSAFRGPSGPAALWAVEQALDELALAQGRDPLELRRIWDPDPVVGWLCDWAGEIPAWKSRGPQGQDTGRFRRGVGVALSAWFHLVDTDTEVQLIAEKGGRIQVSCAVQDIGTGSRTVLANVVAASLGISKSQLSVVVGDSSQVHGPISGGSQATTSMVPAAEDAAQQLKDHLLQMARSRLQKPDARWVPGGIESSSGPLSLTELLSRSTRLTFVGRRRNDAMAYLPFSAGGIRMALGNSVGLQVSVVEVDTRLGKVRLTDSHTGLGVGRIISPELARSQVQGAVIQGMGFALHEERRLDHRSGRTLSSNLEDYRLPGLGDIPRMEVHFEERGREDIRGGAMGLSELATIAMAASIGNAVTHATGHRFRDLPLRPDLILEGLAR